MSVERRGERSFAWGRGGPRGWSWVGRYLLDEVLNDAEVALDDGPVQGGQAARSLMVHFSALGQDRVHEGLFAIDDCDTWVRRKCENSARARRKARGQKQKTAQRALPTRRTCFAQLGVQLFFAQLFLVLRHFRAPRPCDSIIDQSTRTATHTDAQSTPSHTLAFTSSPSSRGHGHPRLPRCERRAGRSAQQPSAATPAASSTTCTSRHCAAARLPATKQTHNTSDSARANPHRHAPYQPAGVR